MTESGTALVPRCHSPWQEMVIDSTGTVMPCCFYGAYGNNNTFLGNVNEQTLEEVWNGPGYQELRKNMAAGDLAAAGCVNCHAVKQGNQLAFVYDPECEKEIAPQSQYLKNTQVLKREIALGSTVLEAKPTVVSLTPSHKCNLRCLHCYQTDTRSTTLDRPDAEDEVLELVPVLARLNASGGEPLVFPKWVNFVEQFSPTRNPYMVFAITTNATVLTPRMERALPKFKELSVSVSLDGTGEVFERVRVGACFEEVRDNIRRLKSIVDSTESPESNIGLSMCVMKSDVSDIANFVKFAVAEGILININPVTAFPADESLCWFNDPLDETRGWRDSYAEARRVLIEKYVTMQVEKSEMADSGAWHQSLQDWWSRNIDLIESVTPWDALARTHYRLLLQPPVDLIEEYIEQYGDEFPLYAYFFPENETDYAKYYAEIVRSNSGYGIEVSLPAGSFSVGIASKWNVISHGMPSWGVEVHPEGNSTLVRFGSGISNWRCYEGDAAVWGQEVQQTYKVRCLLTENSVEAFRPSDKPEDPLYAFVFPIDSEVEPEDQYYPVLIEFSADVSFFELRIPAGYYRVSIAPKGNQISSRFADFEFRIEEGPVSSVREVKLVRAKVQWSRHLGKSVHGVEWVVSNRFSRRLGKAVRSVLKGNA